MFRVIVLGGVALVDCGGRILPEPPIDASTGADANDEDAGFSFGQLDVTPIDVFSTSDVVFPPAEANAPPEGED